jgi:hypothetical protein
MEVLRITWRLGQLVAMTCSRIMVVRFFVRVQVIRQQAEGIQVGCDSVQHADHPAARSKATNSVSTSSSGRRFTTTFSPRYSRCSQSVQRRNTSTSLAKPDRIWFPTQAVRLFSFHRNLGSIVAVGSARLEPSGALRSWWIRLKLSPVAPAILRIDRPAWWAETIAQIRST